MVSPDKIQHDHPCFDNNRQCFWQLIIRSVQCDLALLRQGVDQNLLEVISV